MSISAMMSASVESIACKGCNKPLLATTILKHLSHKPHCKAKYQSSELTDLVKKSAKRSKALEKTWKHKDYETNKVKHSKKRAEQYNREKVKSCGDLLQRIFLDFQASKGKRIKLIKGKSGEETKRQLQAIEQKLLWKHKELQGKIAFELKNHNKADPGKLTESILDEWRKTEMDVFDMLQKIVPKDSKELEEIQQICKPPSHQFTTDLDQESEPELKCKSCNKPFKNKNILKHISKSKKCMADYQSFQEDLEAIRNSAQKRKKERRRSRYKRETEDLRKLEKMQYFLSSKWDLARWQKYDKERAGTRLTYWKGIACRGERCRKDIQKMKDLNNKEINSSMEKLEKFIHEKINELEKCLEEVDEEVKNVTGHWVFDENGSWEKVRKQDFDFCSSMFTNVHHHIDEEMESLYTNVLQVLKDTCEIHGLEFKLRESDERLYEPTRSKYICKGGWIIIPRSVILK